MRLRRNFFILETELKRLLGSKKLLIPKTNKRFILKKKVYGKNERKHVFIPDI
jgi:hypothetical protein